MEMVMQMPNNYVEVCDDEMMYVEGGIGLTVVAVEGNTAGKVITWGSSAIAGSIAVALTVGSSGLAAGVASVLAASIAGLIADVITSKTVCTHGTSIVKRFYIPTNQNGFRYIRI